MLVFATFWGLFLLMILQRERALAIRTKSREDWLLDSIGLLFQGFIIPLLQLTVVFQLYRCLLPQLQGVLVLPAGVAFLISFVAVDYLYYWNHRLLHHRWFWALHQVHHTVTERDVLGTSRNTLWTSFFILYLWVHGFFIYLLADSREYLFGVSLTAALDLWRHSAIEPQANRLWVKFLASWLIFPRDHAWHHSRVGGGNYGANFKLWDRWHGTECQQQSEPLLLGVETRLTLVQKLFFPFEGR